MAASQVKLPFSVVEDADGPAIVLSISFVSISASQDITVDLPTGQSVLMETPVEDTTTVTAAVLI